LSSKVLMFAFASCAIRPKMDCLTMLLPFVLLGGDH
jgi:hypothetical protein